MLCAKSIDEIYDEVKDCSLVITNDIALVTALNSMVDSARIGTFAETPRMIAASLAGDILKTGTVTDLELITIISEETGLDFKFVHSEVENIRTIRRYTQQVRKHLHTNASRKVYDSYVKVPTIEMAMEKFDYQNSEFLKRQKRIAVVGSELFDQLDRQFIPDECDFIEIFKEGCDYEIQRIHQIGNDRQIAENAVAMIPQDRPQDYAIVVKTDSPMADAVRSALYRKGLPFINKMSVRDLDYIRDYLNFITLALDFQTLRVKDVKEIFSNYNGYFNHGKDNYLLHRQTPEDMKERCWMLFCLMRDIRSHTFGELSDICSKEARIQVRIVLDELGLLDKDVSAKLVNRLTYAVDNVRELRHSTEIPADEKMGVLVADCSNSMFMDRPIVLYLGMEQDWNPNLVGRPYVDVEDETYKQCLRMQSMLQQGQHRFYLVNSTKNGEVARPSLLFDEIFNNTEFVKETRNVKGFSDICDELIQGRWYDSPEPAIISHGGDQPGPKGNHDYFSQSSFAEFYKCPRAYMYHALISTDNEKKMEFGSLIHDFAELYLCYPEKVDELGLEEIASMVSEKYIGLSTPLMVGIDRDRIIKAMVCVRKFIDDLGFRPELNRDVTHTKYPNSLFVALGLEKGTTSCETDNYSRLHKMHGKFDLMTDRSIFDYKTGNPKSYKDIHKEMSFSEKSKYPNFQPLVYLAIARELYGIDVFNLFYIFDNDSESSADDYNIRRSYRKIIIKEGDIFDALATDECIDKITDTVKKDFKPHSRRIIEIIREHGSDDIHSWSVDDSILSRMAELANIKKNIANNVKPTVDKIVNLVKDGMVLTDEAIIIPTSTLDVFTGFIDEEYKRMCHMTNTEFPPMPRIDCKECTYKSLCTRDMVRVVDEEEME